jgi:tRNA dimethylallyltransferase
VGGAVKALDGRALSLTAERMIGIPQIKKYLAGEYDLKSAAEDIKQRTRNYAKRQLTWFRKEKRIIWIDLEKKTASDAVREMKKVYDKKAD